MNSYKNPTDDIIIIGLRQNAFPLTSETRQGRSLTSLFFNIGLKVLARIVSQEKEIKGTLVGKKK